MDGWLEGRMDEWINRRMDRWTDRWIRVKGIILLFLFRGLNISRAE